MLHPEMPDILNRFPVAFLPFRQEQVVFVVRHIHHPDDIGSAFVFATFLDEALRSGDRPILILTTRDTQYRWRG